jgi:hypothetical protein
VLDQTGDNGFGVNVQTTATRVEYLHESLLWLKGEAAGARAVSKEESAMRAQPSGQAATVGETSMALRSGYSTDSGGTKKPRPVGRRRLKVMILAVANIFIAGGEAAVHGGYSAIA